MAQSKRQHSNCEHFGYRACPHKDDEIMEKATQDIPEYHGGKYAVLSIAEVEEIDAICSKCDKFTKRQKRN